MPPRKRTIVICFGRFNPPTTGHEALLQFALKTAQSHGGDLRVFPSQSQDAKKNPLPFAEKIKFLKTLFPHVAFNENTSIRTPIDALMAAAKEKYTDAILIVGSDRVEEFMRFQKYVVPASSPQFQKDKHIPLNSYQVIPVPATRGGSGVSGMSASKQRAFAVAGDYESFKQGVPGQNDRVARAIYTAVRKHMNIKESARLRALIDKNTFRLPIHEAAQLHERGNHDEEWHVKCKKCGNEWYSSEGKFAQKCKKCGNKDHTRMTFTGSETVYEAADSFTVMAFINNKIIWSIHSLEKSEINDAAAYARKHYANAIISVENKGGKIVKVWRAGEHIEEQIKEAADSFTVMAFINNKIIWSIKNLEKSEINDAAGYARKHYANAIISVEDKGGKIVKVWKPFQHITEASGMPLKGHPWHKKSDAELHYIVKDASAAAKAMRGHNRQAEDKYLDQANDASSILYYRKNGGKQIKEDHLKVGDRVHAGMGVKGGAGYRGVVQRIDGNDIYINVGREKFGDRIIRVKHDKVIKEAEVAQAKPASEVERLKTRQKQDEIALKQRQANELMAAKLRDVQQKAREQQAKANAPKGASTPASR